MTVFLSVVSFFLTSFYSLQFQDVDGNTVSMNGFQGKKVLIVNIATGSDRVGQLSSLQQLYQQHQDSLVVVAFPSNSFGHDSLSNQEIKQFCQNTYSTTFLIASKSSVIGNAANSVFNWLAKKTENGLLNADAKSDFQKFLISKEGKLVAILSPKIDPLSNSMLEAISKDY